MNGIGIFSPPAMSTRTDERSRCVDAGHVEDRANHRGRGPHGGHARPFDLVDDALGVEHAVDDRRRAHRDHRGGDEVERADVVQRPARQADVGAR